MKIRENFISQKDFENLSSVMMSNHIPYYFKNNVAHKGDKDFYFTHELFNEKKKKADILI